LVVVLGSGELHTVRVVLGLSGFEKKWREMERNGEVGGEKRVFDLERRRKEKKRRGKEKRRGVWRL
jgi:hypothetical protein